LATTIDLPALIDRQKIGPFQIQEHSKRGNAVP